MTMILIWIYLIVSFLIVDYTAGNFLGKAFSRSLRQTLREMEIEDDNAVKRIDDRLERRLIVMPLEEEFNPSQASEMHGKIQHGDKCSIPASLGRLIFDKPYEVPWLFEITPVRDEDYTKSIVSFLPPGLNAKKTIELDALPLDKAYISPLDFRSPENFIFLPQWLMKSLDLKPNDLVNISFIRIKLASLVVLQPLSLEWDELLAQDHNPKTILEHEVNKYSSLTAETVISIEFKGTVYPFFVKEVRAEGNLAVQGVRIQDSDVKVDIDRELLDELIERKKHEPAEEEEDEEEEEELTTDEDEDEDEDEEDEEEDDDEDDDDEDDEEEEDDEDDEYDEE